MQPQLNPLTRFDPAKEPALEFKPHRPLSYVFPTSKAAGRIHPLSHRLGCRKFIGLPHLVAAQVKPTVFISSQLEQNR